MKNIKKYITMAVAGAMILSFTGCNIIERTPESIGKTVLAKVDGEKITKADLDKAMISQVAQYKSQYGEDYESNAEIAETLKQAKITQLDNLVSEKVLISKVKEFGIDDEDPEIQKQVDEQIASYKEQAGTDEAYVEFLAQYGYTTEDFGPFLKKQALISKVIEKMVEDVTATDEELQTYYDENTETLKINPGAKMTHILFTDATNGEAQAKAARELIIKGKTFADIKAMDEYKDNEAVITEDLGHQDFENNTILVPEFVAGFKSLPVNEISQPVKTSFGWHIIKNTEINTEIVTPTFEESKTSVETTVLNAKKEKEITSKLEEYKKDMGVKLYEDKL